MLEAYSSGSVIKALIHLFPDIGLDETKFVTFPSMYIIYLSFLFLACPHPSFADITRSPLPHLLLSNLDFRELLAGPGEEETIFHLVCKEEGVQSLRGGELVFNHDSIHSAL